LGAFVFALVKIARRFFLSDAKMTDELSTHAC
jgi:hypothetical protein